ncbi:hypothetical protein LTR37_019575 [Vermiconidia calcicola]|uniref:Uncharacterized protein n=1 Tax=Vermiconidia calcicola TaxID=1690605 RepID=A0ACC3MFL3_9PEZI|nr:hypothetical protein LTR37_019575 [Vermiconidia calcicola]
MSHWISGYGSSSGPRGSGDKADSNEPTVLIIGAGTFGTSTAYHLAHQYRDPSKVTIVDRADSPPKPAAAVDINRVVRTDYAKPLYSNLAYEAWHAWYWSGELQQYFHKVGWIMIDDTDDSSLSNAIRRQFVDRGYDPTEAIPLEDIETKWDGIMKGTDLQDFKNAYFNEETGWCDAAGATHRFMQIATGKGVNRVTADVTEIILSDDQSKVLGVRTADGKELKADKVLIAAGSWTSSLLSPLEDTLSVPVKDRTENQLRAIGVLQIYYPVSSEEVQRLEKAKMPVVIYGQKGEVLPPSSNNKLLKYTHNQSFTNSVTTKSGSEITAPTGTAYQNQTGDIPDSLKSEAEAGVLSRLLPEFTRGKKPDHWRVCYDARSPTEDFLICRYPHKGLNNLFVASGGSSHSYKFLPNAGKYVLNVLNGESNGKEKDDAWAWKEQGWDARDRTPEQPKLGAHAPKRELKDIGTKSKL